jgi:CHAT domain-containing protein/tetratricopeptide (TPR) repeat protein
MFHSSAPGFIVRPSRLRTAGITLLLLAVGLCPSPSHAQQSHLDELNAKVEDLFSKGEYAKAMEVAAEAVRVAEAAFGPNDAKLAEALNNLAVMHEELGEYADAEPLFQRSIAVHEKAQGPNHPDVAMAVNNLAMVYTKQGKFHEAEPLYQRALQIDEKALGPEDPNVALFLNNLGSLYESLGKLSKAEPLYKRSLAIREKALGPDHPDVAQTLNNLAGFYARLGRYADSEPLYQRSLRIYEKALGPDHPGVALAVNNLAELYRNEGRYIDAEPLYQRALRIYEKALGPDSPDVAVPLSNLGTFYVGQGKYAEAEPLFNRSEAILEKALGPDHPNIAILLNNLVALYSKQGKYEKAEALLKRSLAIQEKSLGPDHSDVGASLNNLALIYDDQGNYAQAEPLYLRSLAIKEKALGPDNPNVATSLDNLARFYSDRGRFAEAEPLYQRALRIDEKALGPDHPDVAQVLSNLAELYRAQHKYSEAEPLEKRSLAIREKALGPDHPDVTRSLYNFAALCEDEGKYEESETFYQRALDNLYKQFLYSFTYMTEKQRLAFLDTVVSDFPGYFSFVHQFRQQDPQLSGSMYNLLLWEKGLISSSIADLRHRVDASADKDAVDMLDRLAAKRSQFAALMSITPPDRELWRQQIDQLQTEADAIEKSLVARSSSIEEKQKLDRATWQQVRDSLAPNEAAVEFARFRYYERKWTDAYYYVALVVTRETRNTPQYVFLGDERELEVGALASFQNAVQSRGFTIEQDAAVPGAKAYRLIWKPLEGALAGKARIYISPDGILNQIPLGLVPAPGGKLLMERYDLRLLSSTKDILRAPPAPTAAMALLVGDPVFDLNEEQQRAALQKLAHEQPVAHLEIAALSPNDLSRDAGNETELQRLPGTGTEVEAISRLMKNHGWKTGVYLREDALKSVVEQANGPRLVHLATHGFFLPDQRIKPDQAPDPTGLEDPMLRSGLYFAGADRTLAGRPAPEGLDNGVLTALEASTLNLTGTELVVLSACNTGRGDEKNGEGVFGLRRALQEAGAQAVLMSLWSIPDKETLELMQRFYAKWLAGTEKHEALKQAQLEMRKKVMREHGSRDLPYYWGAFVLVGR